MQASQRLIAFPILGNTEIAGAVPGVPGAGPGARIRTFDGLGTGAAPGFSPAEEDLIQIIKSLAVFQRYERAFRRATSLAFSLQGRGSWQLSCHRSPNENAFCALMAERNRSCAACLRIQQKLTEMASIEAKAIPCHFGLWEAAVPLRIVGTLAGFLRTGQVFQEPPTPDKFLRTLKMARGWGIDLSEDSLRRAYFNTRVIPERQLESILDLLRIFSQHLTLIVTQVLVRRQCAEPPPVTRAKEFIRQHYSENISLGSVAKVVNASSFYFCKIFRRSTGASFTQYVARLRIEQAQQLLLNSKMRVSQVALEVGFRSLTHFNRVFKKISGQPPSEFRSLPASQRRPMEVRA